MRHQEERGAGHRVEEELDRRVDASFAAPSADHQVHRDEHAPRRTRRTAAGRAPGTTPSTAVSSTSIAHHVQPDVLLDPPRRQHRRREQERGQQHHPQADAVDADQVLQPDALHPGRALDHLEARASARSNRPSMPRETTNVASVVSSAAQRAASSESAARRAARRPPRRAAGRPSRSTGGDALTAATPRRRGGRRRPRRTRARTCGRSPVCSRRPLRGQRRAPTPRSRSRCRR